MVLQNLCTPALIYFIFSFVQIGIDTLKGLFNTAFVKLFVSLIITFLLNYLCSKGLGIISWFIVFIPFILMSLIITILLLVFGLDPATGKIIHNNKDHRQHKQHTIKPQSHTSNIDNKNGGFYDNYNDSNVNTIIKKD